jgi:diacylglycerol kinase family enzyme
MSDRTLVLINPASSRARKAWVRIKAALGKNDIRCDVQETTSRGEGETLTRNALNAGYQTIAVVGGDGTISKPCAVFFRRQTSKALLLRFP